jgi:hypothetical protein
VHDPYYGRRRYEQRNVKAAPNSMLPDSKNAYDTLLVGSKLGEMDVAARCFGERP